jgi:hypothetical protein
MLLNVTSDQALATNGQSLRASLGSESTVADVAVSGPGTVSTGVVSAVYECHDVFKAIIMTSDLLTNKVLAFYVTMLRFFIDAMGHLHHDEWTRRSRGRSSCQIFPPFLSLI